MKVTMTTKRKKKLNYLYILIHEIYEVGKSSSKSEVNYGFITWRKSLPVMDIKRVGRVIFALGNRIQQKNNSQDIKQAKSSQQKTI